VTIDCLKEYDLLLNDEASSALDLRRNCSYP